MEANIKTYRDVEVGDTLYAVHIDKLQYNVKSYELKVISKLQVSTLDNPSKQDTNVIVCDPFMVVRYKGDDNPISDLIYTYPDCTKDMIVLYADKELANERLTHEVKCMQSLLYDMLNSAKYSLDMYNEMYKQLIEDTKNLHF